MSSAFIHSRQLILEPQKGSPWADEMVLNPAILQDPQSNRLHMLFRATGPWPEKQMPGKPLPYPIFLGYAFSDDLGQTWQPDFSRPALAPKLEDAIEKIYIKNCDGDQVVNYANGCVEDPRWFWLDGECFLTVACRMFPPGPYWINDEPTQCGPEWIQTDKNPFGRAASENVTVNVLYKVNLNRLTQGQYEEAFQYVTHLTNPEYGENRDVMFFPEKLMIQGQSQYVCLHRPSTPQVYPFVDQTLKPSMFLCAANRFDQIWKETRQQMVLASPLFDWEGNRIGASAPPIKLGEKEWLLSYHGKKDDETGYTQSFMILEEQPDTFPTIKHRCSERLIVPEAAWEMPGKFKIPCIFITGMIQLQDTFMISYGAGDEKVGIAKIEASALVDYVRRFDAQGRQF